MRLKERFELARPLDQMEVALVRAACETSSLITPGDEAILRTAISLARLYKIRHEGRDVGVSAFLRPFRAEVLATLQPLLLRKKKPSREELGIVAPRLRKLTLDTQGALVRRMENRLPRSAIDQEVRKKSLVIVAGGGGGTAYAYLGVLAMLDEAGLKPALMAGTSMGAILSMFVSRMARFDSAELMNIVRGLTWKKLFRAASMENRYGLPAALRLFLRAGIGRYFNVASESHGSGLMLKELPVPTIVTVSGIRRGMLPHPLEFYERLLSLGPSTLFDPLGAARRVQAAAGALGEFFLRPEIMVKLTLGADPETAQFDALDAAGFSSALPGVIHYDVLREDARMRSLLDGLFEKRDLFRLVDGGLTDNLPSRAAWRAVQRGFIGTRNVFILALNAFSPKLTTPLWLPLQRLAAMTVSPNLPYAHLQKDFRRALSPLELVPSVELVTQAMEMGREQLQGELPFLRRMMTSLPALDR